MVRGRPGPVVLWGSAWGHLGVATDEADGHPAAEEIDTLVRYLQRHQERLDYRIARKGSYPVRSGGIESANTFICHVRLKRSGAWWYTTNANQALALRCTKYDGTFDLLFDRSQQRIPKKAKQMPPKK
jgi:hypothetical protein